jgi:hypothetical protein
MQFLCQLKWDPIVISQATYVAAVTRAALWRGGHVLNTTLVQVTLR